MVQYTHDDDDDDEVNNEMDISVLSSRNCWLSLPLICYHITSSTTMMIMITYDYRLIRQEILMLEIFRHFESISHPSEDYLISL